LRTYISICAARDNQSYNVFAHLDDAVQLISNDTNRYEEYRKWLLSVLYFAPQFPNYYCACLGSIAGTFKYGKYHPLGYLAVMRFIERHTSCGDGSYNAEYAKDSAELAYSGYNTADSNLPSLDSLGLGLLLHLNAVQSPTTLSNIFLLSKTSNPNPFTKETTLKFTLNRMAYTTIAIYDELGRLVWGDGRGSSLEAGWHTVHIDGKDLPHGTLYARISTGFGEVKTVKLVHE
jgi:hypothetical protein